jgi:ribosomal protein L5
VENIHGLDVAVVTSAKNDVHAAALLKAFNFPFVS